ncbi:hypothetical protein LTR59_018046 [Friedmanniomyces endolithicus]|nr:hypothetical protein LTR59_018046 [Friedmanniomyces endolithicus]KAK0768944.1 hypothetical protein LTR38_018015 [Friedmanniomyces endolithicus]
MTLKSQLSEGYTYGKAKGNDNSYTLGLLGGKPVVLVAPRDMGTTNTARGLHISFPNIMYAWVVGIAGGATFTHDGKEWKEEYENGFRRRTDVESVLPRTSAEVANFVDQFVRGRSEAFNRILRKINADLAGYSKLQTGPWYRHKHRDPDTCPRCNQCTEWYHEVCKEALQASCVELACEPCRSNPVRETNIRFRQYASGNAGIASGHRRDVLIRDERIIGFEMEGAGAWEVFGMIVIKGWSTTRTVTRASNGGGTWRRGQPCGAAAMIEEIELPDSPHTDYPPSVGADTLSPGKPVPDAVTLPAYLVHGLISRATLAPSTESEPQYTEYTPFLERLESRILWKEAGHSSQMQAVLVLSGMGGVGKSDTILQFLEKNDQALRESSGASARADLQRISRLCGWPLDGAEAVFGAGDHLARSTRLSLLILDNCDNVKMDYGRYITHGSQVTVILTTRLSDARKWASPDPQDSQSKLFLQLTGLDPESAIDLEASETQRNQETIREASRIATALDHHPLAVTVASSLIEARFTRLKGMPTALERWLA